MWCSTGAWGQAHQQLNLHLPGKEVNRKCLKSTKKRNIILFTKQNVIKPNGIQLEEFNVTALTRGTREDLRQSVEGTVVFHSKPFSTVLDFLETFLLWNLPNKKIKMNQLLQTSVQPPSRSIHHPIYTYSLIPLIQSSNTHTVFSLW